MYWPIFVLDALLCSMRNYGYTRSVGNKYVIVLVVSVSTKIIMLECSGSRHHKNDHSTLILII